MNGQDFLSLQLQVFPCFLFYLCRFEGFEPDDVSLSCSLLVFFSFCFVSFFLSLNGDFISPVARLRFVLTAFLMGFRFSCLLFVVYDRRFLLVRC